MVFRVWPSDRVKVNGTYGRPAVLSSSSMNGTVAIPLYSSVGAAVPGVYDPRALSPVFLCGSVVTRTCSHGDAVSTYHCPPHASSGVCYNASGAGLSLSSPLSVYEWSGTTVTEWSAPDPLLDTLALITSGVLLLVLLYLPSASSALVRNWASATLVLHVATGGSVEASCLFSAGAAAAGCLAVFRRSISGLRLSIAAAVIRHVPPHALGLRSAEYARFFMSLAVLSECHQSPVVGVLVGAGLTLECLFPLFRVADAIILSISLFIGGWISLPAS